MNNDKKMEKEHRDFMESAIQLAEEGMDSKNGGPFGAVVVKNGKIVGKGCNLVTPNNDPTAHAEVVAIRDACKNLNTFQLENCVVYTSCEPCPMCLGALYWARPAKIFYACSREDAAQVGFDDEFIYKEIKLPLDRRKMETQQIGRQEALRIFKKWDLKQEKTPY